MTSLALSARSSFGILSELIRRHRTLAGYGLALLVLTPPVLMMIAADPRLLPTGISPWLKPGKFLVSIGLFALTAAWFFGYVRPERRDTRLLRWTVGALILSASFELFWITWQAAHGVDSHFNNSTPLNSVMFSLMGLFALILTATTLPLAWEIARRPAEGLPGDYVAAVVAGLVLTWLLGTGAGLVIAFGGGPTVGAEGLGLPVLGWNRLGGDVRVAHFLGIHAEQLIPAAAALIGGFTLTVRRRMIVAGVIAYVAVTLAVLDQALAGRPLIPA
ncbi:hypothetical protein [Sphingosinicella sp. YJ22]|uniref:hypothetical protein n=1 Tax=Sphingosinicella sp. YJ22 TaxID=1104780 RepID=UPI00140982B0|nr:hypothetical protein [Sphingosinicella sp. YJ22]